MFAVKGWSVDPASLKPQTELFKSSGKGDGEAQKSSKKRKTSSGEGLAGGGSEDVSRLWERHVEGKVEPKLKKKKERKRQKVERSNDDEARVEAQSKPQISGAEAKGSKSVTDEEVDAKSRKEKKKRKGKQESAIPEKTQDAAPESRSKSLSTSKSAVPVIPPPPAAPGKLTSMQSAMRQKLISARFRHLNETLYTKPSTAAQQLFDENPEMFGDYHAGFRQQVSVWPENPIDKFIAEIRSRGKIRQPKKEDKGTKRHWKEISQGKIEPLPRTHGTSIIADLGCGDARLAQTLKDSGDTTQLNLRLHSFDLHSQSSLVTKADISNVPLEDGSVDIAIFCLALMGTNWISFIEEAYRILHWKGELWVAEIKSRFGRVGKSKGKVVEHSVGSKRKQEALKAAKEAKKRSEDDRDEQDVLHTEVDGVPTNTEETDVSAFVDVLKRRGFVLKSANGVDLSNKMFVKMEFVKALAPTKGKCVPDETKPGMKKAKTKFIPELEDEVLTEDETGTLKPCLYKIR